MKAGATLEKLSGFATEPRRTRDDHPRIIGATNLLISIRILLEMQKSLDT
jgi:hypothetical protein